MFSNLTFANISSMATSFLAVVAGPIGVLLGVLLGLTVAGMLLSLVRRGRGSGYTESRGDSD